VNRSEVESLYRIKTKAMYKGHPFEAVSENNGKISIVTMIGDYRVWLSLGMECMDKGVYQKWISKDEADLIVEKEEL
jgi:hypothetical protein